MPTSESLRFTSLAALLLLGLGTGAMADGLEPLQSLDLVRVPEPLPETSPLVAPAEPLPLEPAAGAGAPADSARSAEEAEVIETVDRWLVAWWQQEVDDYLAFYAEGFKVPENLDRRAWEEERRERLVSPSFITIQIEPPILVPVGESRYRAQFIQHYRSDFYQDTVLKVLELTREAGRWKILREESKAPFLQSTQASI